MKKTLLIAAAALAAGVISTQAQPVYSQNIVGYYNISVPAAKYALISQQLVDSSGGSQVNVQLTNGIPDGSSLLLWNGAGFDALTFFEGFGWYDTDGNLATNSLSPGFGAFLQNGSTTASAAITVIGNVVTGSVTNVVPQGYGVYALPFPVGTNIDSVMAGFPSGDGDSYLHWSVPAQTYDNTYTYFAGFGWYDQDGGQVYPTPNVGEGFFYQHAPPNTSSNWISTFNP